MVPTDFLTSQLHRNFQEIFKNLNIKMVKMVLHDFYSYFKVHKEVKCDLIEEVIKLGLPNTDLSQILLCL